MYMKEHSKQFLKNYSISTLKIILYSLTLITITFLLYYSGIEISDFSFLNQTNIELFIKNAGSLSWVVYIFLIALTVLSPLTSSTLVLIGGYLFNPLLAIAFTIIGEILGATGNFFIGRKLGKKIIIKKFPKIEKMIHKYEGYLNRQTIFLLALIPVGSSNFTGYLCGISHLKYRQYIFPWISGITILNIAVAFLGYSAKIQSLSLSVGILGLALIGLIIVKKYK